ncbi:MAG: hypothetical protein QOD99_2644 [Chthoniobacter sp.]|jgi:hypothetical protein|nr:hypothetical protein [Chthoniobacter sp.]
MGNEIRKVSIGFWFFAGIAMFCGFAVLAWILFRFAAPRESFEDKRVKARVEKLQALRKEDEPKLNTYVWIAKDKGTVQLPITRAMEVTTESLRKKPVHASAVKVEVPYPYGLQPPPNAPAGTAPATGTNPSASPAPSAAPNTNAPELKK